MAMNVCHVSPLPTPHPPMRQLHSDLLQGLICVHRHWGLTLQLPCILEDKISRQNGNGQLHKSEQEGTIYASSSLCSNGFMSEVKGRTTAANCAWT